jgi:hypothetical protein
MLHKGEKILFLKVRFYSSLTIFANLPILTLITLVCDVPFKIKSFLFVDSSIFGVVQWQGTNILLFLKVCVSLDFFFIAIDSYGICL